MDRGTSSKLLGGAIAAGALGSRAGASAARAKTMVAVVKEAGVAIARTSDPGPYGCFIMKKGVV